jgi:hypothetical protein
MKTINRILGLGLIIFFHLLPAKAFSHTQTIFCAETGDIKGTVKDETGKPVGYANIVVLGVGAGAVAAEDGSFSIRSINPGKYDVQASFTGMNPQVIKGVSITANAVTYLDFKLTLVMGKVVVIKSEDYVTPIVDKNYTTMTTIPAKTVMEMERGNIVTMITNLCSSCSETNDHQLVMRGARPGTVEYVVDGERQWGITQVPSQMIEQVTVLSGGIPAEYGDLSGGVVIISTKNYISGMRESRDMQETVYENKESEKKASTPAPKKVKKEKRKKKVVKESSQS